MSDYVQYADSLTKKEAGSPGGTRKPPTEEEVLHALLGSPKFGNEAGLQMPTSIDLSSFRFGVSKRKLDENYSDGDEEDDDDVERSPHVVDFGAHEDDPSKDKGSSIPEQATPQAGPSFDQGSRSEHSSNSEPAAKKVCIRPDFVFDSDAADEEPHPHIVDLPPKPTASVPASAPDLVVDNLSATPAPSDEVASLLSARFEEIKSQSIRSLHDEHNVPWHWAQAISETLATVCTKTFWNVSSLRERHGETAQHLQELYARSSQLSQNSEKTNSELEKFKNRRWLKELQAEFVQLKAEIEKLRSPDVTLESMEKQIDEFKDSIVKQNANIDKFKDGCAKELDRVADVRKSFKRETKEQKNTLKDDIAEVDQRLVLVEETIDEATDSLKVKLALLDDKIVRLDQIVQGHIQTLYDRVQDLKEQGDDFGVEHTVTLELFIAIEERQTKQQEKLARVAAILLE